MKQISIDESYGINDIIWPIINEFQTLLDRNKDVAEWSEGRKYKNLEPFILTIKNNEIINHYSDKYVEFFERKSNRTFDLEEIEKIKFGFVYSLLTHMDEKRKVGGHYFNHINSISIELAKSGWDIETIIGGFIHDTVENKIKRKETNEKIRNKTFREFFIDDYLNSRKVFLDNNDSIEIEKKTEHEIENIIKKYFSITNKKVNEDELSNVKEAIKKEKEYGLKRIISKLSKSSKTRYERYDSDIFNFDSIEVLSKKGKRHYKTNRDLNRLEKKYKGIKKISKEEIERIIISNANKSIAVKIEDRINNIETLNVINYDLEGIVNQTKGIKKITYQVIKSISDLKHKISDKSKIDESVIIQKAEENKEINYLKNLIRKFGHRLQKRHYTSGFITEENYLRSWKKYLLNLFNKKDENNPPIYRSLRHKDKINEYWKNIILIDRLNEYLMKYKDKDDVEYKRLKERGDELIERTKKQVENDIQHTINWHLQPSEYSFWLAETDNYFKQGKIKEITQLNEENDLDGLSYVLNLNINKISEQKIPEQKVKRIRKMLAEDRGYQFAALRSFKEILENYKQGNPLKGF